MFSQRKYEKGSYQNILLLFFKQIIFKLVQLNKKEFNYGTTIYLRNLQL